MSGVISEKIEHIDGLGRGESLRRQAIATNFSGVLRVTDGEEVLFEHVAGLADRAEARPNRVDTLFGIASGTKLLTALAIGQLVDDGHFRLDTPATSLCDLGIAQYDPNITVRQLLSHTSGMPDYLDEELFPDVDAIELAIPGYRLIGPKDYLPLFPRLPMVFAPGTRFVYNNGGFVYLAMIVEAVSGLSYREYINDRLLRPLQIGRGGVYAMNALPENVALGYVDTPHGAVTNIFQLPVQAGGDGGVWMSAPGMLRLWQATVRGEVISQSLLAEFVRPQAAVNPGKGIHYGLGLWLKQTATGFEPYVVGSDAGVSFKSSYNLQTAICKVAVSNTTNGVWRLAREINAF